MFDEELKEKRKNLTTEEINSRIAEMQIDNRERVRIDSQTLAHRLAMKIIDGKFHINTEGRIVVNIWGRVGYITKEALNEALKPYGLYVYFMHDWLPYIWWDFELTRI